MLLFLLLFTIEKKKRKNENKNHENTIYELKILHQNEQNKLREQIYEKVKNTEQLKEKYEEYIKKITEDYTVTLKELSKEHKVEIEKQNKDLEKKYTSTKFIETSMNKINNTLKNDHLNLQESIKIEEANLRKLKELIKLFSDEVDVLEHGFYNPKYNFSNSRKYELKLKFIRDEQKFMMIYNQATIDWTIGKVTNEGVKFSKTIRKQILRFFNNECDAQIKNTTYRNIETIEERIEKIFEQLNKMYEMQGLSIHPDYLELKRKELYLSFEYEKKKQEEKEIVKYERQLEADKRKEERILNEEIKKEQEKINNEIEKYKKVIQRLTQRLKNRSILESRELLIKRIEEAEGKMEEKISAKKKLDFREEHLTAGYVYIISNIGAFGEDVIKIGVTRRLEPLDRIRELSSASVPFSYDVHALIFNYDAFQLESELHRYFDSYRINKVNMRKEFFKVPIESIEEKLKDYDELLIDFKKEADALEYYQSINIKNTDKSRQ